jgi:hypothetical protein
MSIGILRESATPLGSGTRCFGRFQHLSKPTVPCGGKLGTVIKGGVTDSPRRHAATDAASFVHNERFSPCTLQR